MWSQHCAPLGWTSALLTFGRFFQNSHILTYKNSEFLTKITAIRWHTLITHAVRWRCHYWGVKQPNDKTLFTWNFVSRNMKVRIRRPVDSITTIVAFTWLPVACHTLIVVFQGRVHLVPACSFDVRRRVVVGSAITHSKLHSSHSTYQWVPLISQTGSSSQDCCQIICATWVRWNLLKILHVSQDMFFLPLVFTGHHYCVHSLAL